MYFPHGYYFENTSIPFYHITAINPYNFVQEYNIPDTIFQNNSPQNPDERYKRTWSKKDIEEAFNSSIQYSQKINKKIEDLDIFDFSIIGIGMTQTPEQIMFKVKEINKNGTLRPGKWSQTEDSLLASLVSKGDKKWGKIAFVLNNEIHSSLKIRNSKTCKERWNNYLNPKVNRGDWEDSEDIKLLEGYLQHGNKWSVIAKSLQNRIESSVKNRIKSLLHKLSKNTNSVGTLKNIIKEKILSLRASQINKT